MILIALGANLPSEKHGTPVETLNAAVERVTTRGMRVTARSRWFESAPVPPSDQPWYVNGVIAAESLLDPRQILETLHEIEQEFGRVRRVRWEARLLDLDLIACRDVVLPDADTWRASEGGRDVAGLVLPHPRMHLRRFVLEPLMDIAPGWRHPVLGLTAGELLQGLAPDAGVIRPLQESREAPI